MNKIHRFVPLACALFWLACSGPEEAPADASSDADPRAEASPQTKSQAKSKTRSDPRAAPAPSSGGIAAEGSWQPTELTRAATTGKQHAVEEALRSLDSEPSLYDLHHSKGALALSGHIWGTLVLEILESAGYETAIDEARGEFSLDGEKRSLWLHYDRSPLELPQTRLRWSLPPRVGVIAVTEQGIHRLSDGESMAFPAQPTELPRFASRWAKDVGVANASRTATRTRAVLGYEIVVTPGEVMIDGLGFAFEEIADELEQTLEPGVLDTVTLRLLPDSSFGDFVALFEQLHNVSDSSGDLRYALPLPGQNQAPVHKLRFDPISEPVMVFKADRRTPWSKIAPIFAELAKTVPEIVLLTNLDVSDPDSITDDTYPGGLPGGLPLSFAPAMDGGEKIVVALGDDQVDFGSEDFENEVEDPTPSEPTRRYRPTPPTPEPEDSGPIFVGGNVTPPVLISGPDATYTEDARQAEIVGLVILQIIIDRNGDVKNVKVLKGLPHGLSEAAVRAVKEYRYEPATKEGEPVAVYFNMTVDFQLGT